MRSWWGGPDRARRAPPYSIFTRAIERDVLPASQRHGLGVITYSPLAGGWLPGRYGKGNDDQGPVSESRKKLQKRFDLSLPENQRKLEAVEKLSEVAEEAGISLIESAIGFVLRHPAVTAAIIGPRTLDHLESQLSTAEVELSDDVLDRIDEIVAPGATINVDDNGWRDQSLEPGARRRRGGSLLR